MIRTAFFNPAASAFTGSTTSVQSWPYSSTVIVTVKEEEEEEEEDDEAIQWEKIDIYRDRKRAANRRKEDAVRKTEGRLTYRVRLEQT